LKTTKKILILFAVLVTKASFFYGQELKLELKSLKKTDHLILENIRYQKIHKNNTSVKKELTKLSDHLKKQGYFTNTIDSILHLNANRIAFFSLGKKIKNVTLKTSNVAPRLVKKFKINNDLLVLPIEKLDSFLENISKKLDAEGRSFSKVSLSSIKIEKERLFATLEITAGKKREIHSIEVKGYPNFPKSFLKNYFRLDKDKDFNKKRMNEIYELTNKLQFVAPLKKPEVLFTPDSTFLFIYLKKKASNSIDALLNFASEDNGEVFFNGNIDLELNNTLDYGEKFKLFWNKVDKDRQELQVSSTIPHLFQSNISPSLEFSLYRQDSSFVTSKFSTQFSYPLNSKHKISISYSSEKSTSNSTNSVEIENYKNFFFGINYKYQTIFKNAGKSKLNFSVSSEFGQRQTLDATKQTKYIGIIDYTYIFNNRATLFLSNTTGYLNSKNYLFNELFRIGGVNTLRGFNEQSLFTDRYSFVNLEYRYKTNKTSYVYTITDAGVFRRDFKQHTALGLGLGYLYQTKNFQINLGLATGTLNDEKINFRNTKLLLSWKNYF